MNRPFDYCLITAANEQQGRGYQFQLDWRQQQGLLPQTQFRIIADPGGARIGSGGSTFFALAALQQELGDAVAGKRILILHSGGDSRRLPAYSVVGKLFTPLPSDKHFALFDVMLDNYAKLPALESGQVIIASGDVLLNFDPQFIDFSPTGLTGVAYPDVPEQGQYFGVYVVPQPQKLATPARDVLQKPDIGTLKRHNAIDFTDRIWIDTGILNLAADAVGQFLACKKLIARAAAGQINFNLYHEVLYTVVGKMQVDDSELLSGIDLFVNCLPYCGFYHVGRSEELLKNYYALTHASLQYQFQKSTRSNAREFKEFDAAWTFNTVVKANGSTVNTPCLIESCILNNKIKLDGRNILTNLPLTSSPFHLQQGVCLNLVPLVKGQWAAVLYGIEDQFKRESATFLNRPLDEFMRVAGVAKGDFWKNEQEVGDPWCAAIFPTAESPDAAIRAALTLQNLPWPAKWKKMRRLSMKEILALADHHKILRLSGEIDRLVKIYTLIDRLAKNPALYAQIGGLARTDQERGFLMQQLKQLAEKNSNDPVAAAKAHHAVAKLMEADPKSEDHVARAFAAIRRGVARGLQTFAQNMHNPHLAVRSDQVTWVLLPARFDFAGGWTDTPPICMERGGCVLNASITLNGQHPIQIIGKVREDDFTIGINSIDLAQRATISSMNELRDFHNPADWRSLPKAAFFASGVFSEREDQSLGDVLKNLGGGIDLTLFSALPSGSGLGTSSILGAGIIAALARMMGVDMPREELYARTSYMEQLMTTGGGWQDHIGGVAGGVKLITTTPGFEQTPTISWTQFKQPDTRLDERFLIYYTGYRRLAKNLLRQVVGRFLEQQPEALDVLDRMADLARSMKEDLDHRRLDDFSRKIRQSWQLNKMLDPGQTTKEIESILARIDDLVLGAKLLGAGGGGFLFIAAKDPDAALRIRRELNERPANDRARFFGFDVDSVGMKISVL